MQRIFAFLAAVFFLAAVPQAGAVGARALAPVIMNACKVPLLPVGTGNYHKLGFDIYQASLWAADGAYNRKKAYALQLEYKRDLSKDTVVGAIMDDLRAQKNTTKRKLNKWEASLTKILPAITKGDEIVALSLPGEPSKIFLNGKQIATISDMELSRAFFNIWLGSVADETLRAQLISKR